MAKIVYHWKANSAQVIYSITRLGAEGGSVGGRVDDRSRSPGQPPPPPLPGRV